MSERTMLRDDRQIALNQVIGAALEAAHTHEQGAELLGQGDPAAALRTLAAERTRAARDLGEHVRRLGDLPKEPDADLETVRELLARVRAAFSDPHDEVIHHARQAEEHLAATVREALEHELPSDTRELLEAMLAAPQVDAVPGRT